MSDFLNFRTAKSQLDTLYGISISDDEFDEIALYAWDKINNKRYQVYVHEADVDEDGYVMLPCNMDSEDSIDSILSQSEDALLSDGRPGFSFTKQIMENYTEAFKNTNHKGPSPLYKGGTLVNYEYLGDRIKITSAIKKVYIIYKGILMDDDGLPYINKFERDAISAFCAFVSADKSSFVSKDKNQEYFAQKYEARWNKLRIKAKSPISVTQNQLDRILDANVRWDRKRYNIGYKTTNR